MKLALPILALGFCLLAFFVRQHHRQGIQLRNTRLQTAIAKHESLHGSLSSNGTQEPSARKSSRSPSPFRINSDILPQLSDEELSELVQNGLEGDLSDFRSTVAFRKMLLEASEEELCDLLDRAPNLSLNSVGYQNFVTDVLTRLGQLAPQTALDRAFAQKDYDALLSSWYLSESFSSWSSNHPEEAVAWLDQRIADGSLLPKSLNTTEGIRSEFEGAAFFSLFRFDSSSARNRLLALSPDLRLDALSANTSSFLDFSDGSEFSELAKLIREALPEHEQGEIMNHFGGVLAEHDLEVAETFLSGVAASQFEIAPIALAAIERRIESFRWHSTGPIEDDLRATREFIAKYSPAHQPQIMGKAFASQLQHGNTDFSEIVSLLEKEHQQNPDDLLLDSFLSNSIEAIAEAPDTSFQTLQTLVAKIEDPALREHWQKQQEDFAR